MPAPAIMPPICALELTYSCNHTCPYCSCPWHDPHEKYPVGKPLSTNTWIQTISHLVARGVSSFILTGGEPTLLPDFDHLIATLARQTTTQPFFISATGSPARRYPVSFVILTNGDTELWTPEFCQSLAGTRCRVHVHWTGPAEVHRTITGGNYDRTLHTIEQLLAEHVDLVLNVPLLQENVGKVTPAIEEVLALGVRHVNVMRVLPVGNARDASKTSQFLPAGAFLRTFQELEALCHKQGATITVGSLVPACAFPSSTVLPSSSPAIPHLCGCGTSSFCIDPSGLIRPCTCSPRVAGSLSHVEDAFTGPAFQSFRQRHRPPACTACSTQDRCSAGCPAAWNDENYARNGITTGTAAHDPWITVPFHGGFTP